MDMTIEIPGGKVFLRGRLVYDLHRKMPYTIVGEDRYYLTPEEVRSAREMKHMFRTMIDKKISGVIK